MTQQDRSWAPKHGLEHHGFRNVGRVYWTLSTPALYERIVRRREGLVSHLGPLVVRTGDHTGRSPNDKFTVHEPTSADHIWWGKVNVSYREDRFNTLLQKMTEYLKKLVLGKKVKLVIKSKDPKKGNFQARWVCYVYYGLLYKKYLSEKVQKEMDRKPLWKKILK